MTWEFGYLDCRGTAPKALVVIVVVAVGIVVVDGKESAAN